MKLDYPCTFDMGRADGRDRLGFDTFINDNSATIGSIPIGDAGTGEVFLMVSEGWQRKRNGHCFALRYANENHAHRDPRDPWEQELYEMIGAEFVCEFGVGKE